MSSRGRTTQQSLPGVCSLQLSLFSLTVSICVLGFWPSSLLRFLLEWLHCDYFCWSPVQGQLGCLQHGVRNSIPFRKASEGSLEKWPCELLCYFAAFHIQRLQPLDLEDLGPLILAPRPPNGMFSSILELWLTPTIHLWHACNFNARLLIELRSCDFRTSRLSKVLSQFSQH